MKELTAIFLAVIFVVTVAGRAWSRDDMKVEFDQLYAHSNYSTGDTSDILASYLIVHTSPLNKVWYGFQRVNYNFPSGFLGGQYSEDFHTVGGYFTSGNNLSYQTDYFRMTNSLSQNTEIVGGEIVNPLGSSFSGGVGYYASTYPFRHVNQYNLRLYYFPSNSLTFNTKIYFTETSDFRRGTCFHEKVDVKLNPSMSLQLEGATGTRINGVDNDISTFYSQIQDLQSSYGAKVTFRCNEQLDIMGGYYRDNFDGFSINKLAGSIRIWF